MSIIRNAIRCNLCGDEIESKSWHDMVWCKCGACAVDGGHDYMRRCFMTDKECFTDISVVGKSDELEKHRDDGKAVRELLKMLERDKQK